MLKRAFAVVIAVFAAVLCYGIELSVWNMPPESDRLYRQLWNEATQNFERMNPGVKIKGISREYKPQEFVSVMASGKGPDVVRIPIAAIPAMAKYGFLADLTPFTGRWIQKDYLPAIMWRAVTVEGRTYGVPYDSNFTVLFYNKRIFNQAGLDRAPENWAELVKYGKKIREKTGAWGLALQPDMFNFIDFIWQAGGDIYRGRELNLNNAGVVKALRFWNSLKWEHSVLPPQNILYENDVEQLFSTGKVAMMIGVAKRLPVMARRYGLALDEVEIAPLPAGDTGIKAWHAGGDAFIINASISDERKEVAWRYINNSLSPISQLWQFMRMKELGIPIFPGDFSASTNLINRPEFANVKGLFESAMAEPTFYRWPHIKEDFNRYVLEHIFINKNPDYEKLLFDFMERVKKEYYGG